MDIASRRAWGKVTGLKYGLIKYNYDVDPVFEVVDLKTGLTTKETAFIKGTSWYQTMEEAKEAIGKPKPDIDYTLAD